MATEKFDRFCFNGRIVELAHALDNDRENLLPEYLKQGGKLLCPEYCSATLKFTKKTSKHKAFLSTKQGSLEKPNVHTKGCSYNYDRATKEQIKEYYTNLSKAQITDKLDAAINVFLKQSRDTNEHRSTDVAENPAIITVRSGRRQIYKSLPKRSFYNMYDVGDEELNIPILLYGKVKLRVEQIESNYRKDELYTRLHIISNKTNRRIRYFNMPNVSLNVDTGRLYFVSLIAMLGKDGGTLVSDLYQKDPPSLKYIICDS